MRPPKKGRGGNRGPSRLSRRTACEPATNIQSSGANWGTKISVREDDDLPNKLRAALAATAPDWKAWLISSPEQHFRYAFHRYGMRLCHLGILSATGWAELVAEVGHLGSAIGAPQP